MEPDSRGTIRMGGEVNHKAVGVDITPEIIIICCHSCGRKLGLGGSFQQRISQKGRLGVEAPH